ncbi:MAG TPA: ribosome small subunit-dependent GTPase A [Candidatus Hydrogenedens sp.]|nr:ribosome small subunit-dependent GTPase A [Candidatus Hydrogenedens sp.]
MKKKKLEKRKRSETRIKNWEDRYDDSFSKDSFRLRKATVHLPDNQPEINLPQDFEPNATVTSHSKKWAFVFLDLANGTEETLCKIDERLKEKDSSLIAPGDRVLVEFEDNGEAIIRGIAPRKSKLSRLSVDREGPPEQVIAANVDILFIVASIKQPTFKPGLIDRFLIVAENGKVEPILVINKIDLANTLPEEIDVYKNLGLKIIFTSCVTKQGIEEIVRLLENKTGVLSGHSGVGKTSLLKCICPEVDAITLEISKKTEKGKHATTSTKLYHLPNGGKLIDTPGIRSLGFWNIDPASLDYYFPEISQYADSCRFNDCSHTHEPECAVREAVKNKEIPLIRYESYLRIRKSIEQDGITPGRLRKENILPQDILPNK